MQCIVGRIQPIILWRPGVMRMRGPNSFERAVQTQHCCAKLRRSGNKRNLGIFWLKSLTGLKLCATIPNNTQQQATTFSRVCKRTCASASGFFLLIDMNTWQWDTNMCLESLRWGQCSRFDSRLLDRTQRWKLLANNVVSFPRGREFADKEAICQVFRLPREI